MLHKFYIFRVHISRNRTQSLGNICLWSLCAEIVGFTGQGGLGHWTSPGCWTSRFHFFSSFFASPAAYWDHLFLFFQFLLKVDLGPFSHQMKNTCREYFQFWCSPFHCFFFFSFLWKRKDRTVLFCAKGWICHAGFYRIQINISLLSNTAGGRIVLTWQRSEFESWWHAIMSLSSGWPSSE